MTKEEAISLLKQYIDYNNADIPDFYTMEEACKVVIKALEQQPTDAVDRVTIKEYLDSFDKDTSVTATDCIRRSDMLDAVGHGTTYTSEEVQDIIDGMPSVTPQPRWIPTSEKHPEKGMSVIWLMEYGDIDSDYYGMLYDRGRKYPDFFIAWMPFPEIPKLT